MNKESLGKTYRKGKDIYECIAYTDRPTVTMKNIGTGEKIGVVIDSMVADEFEEITRKIEKMKIDEVEDAEHLKFKEKINEIIDKINNMEE